MPNHDAPAPWFFMYEICKSVIEAGRFELADMLKKLDTLWVQGSLTDEQRAELAAAARAQADPAASYAPLQQQVDTLAGRVADLAAAAAANAAALAALKAAVEQLGASVTDPEPAGPDEEGPAYTAPPGAHDAYHNGDKVTFNGEHYTCTAPEGAAVVWDPDTYPAYWTREETA